MKATSQSRFKSLLPYFALTVGIFSLSLSAMFVRWADAPGPMTGFYRQFFAISFLFPIFAYRAIKSHTITWKSLIFPILGGVASGCDLGLWSSSLSFTTTSNATLIGNTAPIWVALAGLLFFRERLKRAFWIGLAFTMGGAMLIMGSDFIFHPRFGIGDLMALGTGFFYAGYFLATERGRKHLDPLSYSWILSVVAMLTLMVINLGLKNSFTGFSTQTWITFIVAAIVSQIFGYTALSYALGHLPATIVSPTMLGQPVLTTILAIPLLGEVPQLVQVIGGVITLVGIYIVNQSHNRARDQDKTLTD
jgi:drug/metabolite transporter (DMT)-like permease